MGCALSPVVFVPSDRAISPRQRGTGTGLEQG